MVPIFLTLFKNFFVHKSELHMIISKSMLEVCSQLLSLKPSSSCLDFQFLGSYVGTLFKHKIFQSIFSCIYQRISKSNGGQTLFLPPHIKNWISTKSPTMVQTTFQMPYIILESLLLPKKKSFSSNKDFKNHLKMIQQKAIETLST